MPLRWKLTSAKPVSSAASTKRSAHTADALLSETPALPPQETELASEITAGAPAARASATTQASRRGALPTLLASRPWMVASRSERQTESG